MAMAVSVIPLLESKDPMLSALPSAISFQLPGGFGTYNRWNMCPPGVPYKKSLPYDKLFSGFRFFKFDLGMDSDILSCRTNTARLLSRAILFYRIKGGLQCGYQVFRLLDADEKPNRIRLDAMIQQLLTSQLGMCRACRMDNEGLHIGNICKQ